MSASRTLAAGHSSEMGLYEVPCDESLPGLGIGMTNEVVVVCHDQVRRQVSQGFRCRGS